MLGPTRRVSGFTATRSSSPRLLTQTCPAAARIPHGCSPVATRPVTQTGSPGACDEMALTGALGEVGLGRSAVSADDEPHAAMVSRTTRVTQGVVRMPSYYYQLEIKD